MSITKMRKSFGSGKVLKWIMGIIAVIFCVSIFWSFGAPPDQGRGGGENPNAAVATVNGDPISYLELENAAKQSEREQERFMGDQRLGVIEKAYVRSQALEQLIGRRLKLQAARRERLEVSGRAITAEIDKFARQQIEMLKIQILGEKMGKKATDDQLDRELRRFNSDRLPESVRALHKDLNTREMRAAVEVELLIKALDQKVQSSVKNITDRELIDNYRQVRAQHILIKVGPGGKPDAQAKRKAEEVLKKVRAGEDFAKLAREYSEDERSKGSGGDLGYFVHGQMVPEFDKPAFSLKPGQTSGVVKTTFGYHIIKVLDSKLELPKDFDKNKRRDREELLTQKRYRAQTEYFDRLRKSAKVEIQDPFLQGMHYMQQASGDPTQSRKYQAMARKAFERAAKENPNDASPYVMLVNLYLQNNEKEKARKLLEQILEVKAITEDKILRMQLGRLYQEKKEFDKAVTQYQIASELGYADMSIHYQLQSIYREMNRPDLAAKEEQYIKEFQERSQARQARIQPKSAETEKPEKPEKKTKSGG